MPRKTYHHGDLRRAILDAAHHLVRRDGAHRVSLRAIAREAGVSPAAPYYHFADRDTILAAVAASGFDSLARAMTESAAQRQEDDPLQGLQRAGIAYVRFAAENPELYRLMFSGLLNDRPAFPDLHRAAAAAFDVLQGLLGGATRPGSSGGPPPAIALATWSTVHGLAMLLIDGLLDEESEALDVEQIARDVTRVLGRGLRSFAAPEDS